MKNLNLLMLVVVATVLWDNSRAQKIYTYAGSGITGYTDSGGVVTLAEFNHPWGLALDKHGNLFVADHVNSAIRKITASHVVSTYAGTTTLGHSGDNGPATAAMLERPASIILDSLGNLYIADKADNRIRKIDTAGIITTVAGTGAAGYTGDGGIDTAATFNTPTGIAMDAAGNIYIADSSNNVVRKINTLGIVSTYAGTGTGSYTGDGGPATAATLSGPVGLAIDASGNLLVAEAANNVVRKINTSQVISTFAGSGSEGYTGDGGPATAATFYKPNSIALDRSGNVFITDQENAVVRMVNPSGTIVTTAGNGLSGYSGDGGQAQLAEMYRPMGLAIDSIGNIYIADFINSVIRLIDVQRASVNTISSDKGAYMAVYPDPASSIVSVSLNAAEKSDVQLEMQNMMGQVMYRTMLKNNIAQVDVSPFPNGCYLISAYCNGERMSSVKFVKN